MSHAHKEENNTKTFYFMKKGQKSDHLLRFIGVLEADIRFRYQGFTQETSQLLKKYKNYSHLTSIPGGAGVTSGKKQLTSGSGVGIC